MSDVENKETIKDEPKTQTENASVPTRTVFINSVNVYVPQKEVYQESCIAPNHVWQLVGVTSDKIVVQCINEGMTDIKMGLTKDVFTIAFEQKQIAAG